MGAHSLYFKSEFPILLFLALFPPTTLSSPLLSSLGCLGLSLGVAIWAPFLRGIDVFELFLTFLFVDFFMK